MGNTRSLAKAHDEDQKTIRELKSMLGNQKGDIEVNYAVMKSMEENYSRQLAEADMIKVAQVKGINYLHDEVLVKKNYNLKEMVNKLKEVKNSTNAVSA